MKENIIYKNKYKTLIELLNKSDISNELSKEIELIENTNYLSYAEFCNTLEENNGVTNSILDQLGINYIIVPEKSLVDYKMVISLTDSIISIPCYWSEDEWEIEISEIEKMSHDDLCDIKNNLQNILSSFLSTISNNEPILLAEKLNKENNNIV